MDMVFTVLRATYFKRTKRLFENSDYESFGIINEKCELINTGLCSQTILLFATHICSVLAGMNLTRLMVWWLIFE